MAPKDVKTCLYPGNGKRGYAINMEQVHQICAKCVARIGDGLIPPPDELDGARDGECQARECRFHYVEPEVERERDASGRFT